MSRTAAATGPRVPAVVRRLPRGGRLVAARSAHRRLPGAGPGRVPVAVLRSVRDRLSLAADDARDRRRRRGRHPAGVPRGRPVRGAAAVRHRQGDVAISGRPCWSATTRSTSRRRAGRARSGSAPCPDAAGTVTCRPAIRGSVTRWLACGFAESGAPSRYQLARVLGGGGYVSPAGGVRQVRTPGSGCSSCPFGLFAAVVAAAERTVAALADIGSELRKQRSYANISGILPRAGGQWRARVCGVPAARDVKNRDNCPHGDW